MTRSLKMKNGKKNPARHYHFKPVLVTGLKYIRHVSYLENKSSGMHFHPPHLNELIYVDYGILSLEHGNQHFQLKRGECILIKGRVYHRLSNPGLVMMNYLNIMFYGTLPDSIIGKVLKADRHGHRIMNRLREENITQMDYHPTLSICELTVFLIHLIRRQSGSTPLLSPPAYLGNIHNSIAEKALDIVSRNYKTLKFQELAHSLGISDSSLYLIFKNEIGRTFSQTIQTYRVEAAKYFLHNGELSLDEIAVAIGCETRSFFRLFKRVTGMTPHEYAKSLGTPAVSRSSNQ